MPLPVVFRRVAEHELNDAVAWYQSKREGLGGEFRTEIYEYLDRIANAPSQFPLMRGVVRRALLHRFPYSIYFLPEADRLTVIAVFHSSRAPHHLEGRF